MARVISYNEIMNPITFNRIEYLYLIDDIALRDKTPHEQARKIVNILEQFIDPLLSTDGPLYIDDNYPNSEDTTLDNRQNICRENMVNRLESGELLEAYYEFLDYLLDYDDSHNNRFYRNEVEAIREPYDRLKNLAKQIRDTQDKML